MAASGANLPSSRPPSSVGISELVEKNQLNHGSDSHYSIVDYSDHFRAGFSAEVSIWCLALRIVWNRQILPSYGIFRCYGLVFGQILLYTVKIEQYTRSRFLTDCNSCKVLQIITRGNVMLEHFFFVDSYAGNTSDEVWILMKKIGSPPEQVADSKAMTEYTSRLCQFKMH